MSGSLALSGGPALVHYEQARVALAECAKVDDAARIKDKAEKLAAYARMRDDADMEVWVSEIKLRAGIKIGELSLQLDKSAGGANPKATLPTDGKSKAAALQSAGISTSTANRYEELAGGREKQGQKVAAVAADKYFAEQRKAKEPATMAGLKTAVREAVHATVGKPEPRERPKKRDPIMTAWLDWSGAVKQVAELDAASFKDLAAKARDLKMLKTMAREAKTASRRIDQWISALEKEIASG